ncbi:hypothetical protein IU429_15190 [Nocardia elegans]|uniref:Uncharacterized protein n=1 Tax=Nocardia elegans TaxID=300029 RepID=A0ABW6T822_9NOCA|nr:hypothetical protein [Nocardia elegans]MBF6449015.1 hypothetical protein [Nocardia elegans]
MTVREHDRIDHVAIGPDGRLLLAMTEERSYLDEDSAALDNDFRFKINSYLYGIQSGYVQDLARQSGVARFDGIDIVLYSTTTPTPFVQRALEAVNRDFAGKGIRAWRESLAPDDLGPDVIESALVEEVVRLCGQQWEFAMLWVWLIGQDGDAGIKVIRNRRNKQTEVIAPSPELLALLGEYKHACYEEGAGTWLSGQISIAGPDDYRAEFSKSSDLPWTNVPVSEQNLDIELAAFPRTPQQIPGWIRERKTNNHNLSEQ